MWKQIPITALCRDPRDPLLWYEPMRVWVNNDTSVYVWVYVWVYV